VDLPNLYKRSLIFFRCLHSLVRILPCYNLHRRNVMSDECSLSYRLSTELTTTSNNEAEEIVSFGKFIRNKTKTSFHLYKLIYHNRSSFKYQR
jgi:hypothetical protein